MEGLGNFRAVYVDTVAAAQICSLDIVEIYTKKQLIGRCNAFY